MAAAFSTNTANYSFSIAGKYSKKNKQINFSVSVFMLVDKCIRLDLLKNKFHGVPFTAYEFVTNLNCITIHSKRFSFCRIHRNVLSVCVVLPAHGQDQHVICSFVTPDTFKQTPEICLFSIFYLPFSIV